MKIPFITDGCSWFPDLWIRTCCEDHDYAYWLEIPRMKADLDFMGCIARESAFLGPLAFLFAGGIVAGMALGRPIRNLVKALGKKPTST